MDNGSPKSLQLKSVLCTRYFEGCSTSRIKPVTTNEVRVIQSSRVCWKVIHKCKSIFHRNPKRSKAPRVPCHPSFVSSINHSRKMRSKTLEKNIMKTIYVLKLYPIVDSVSVMHLIELNRFNTCFWQPLAAICLVLIHCNFQFSTKST